MLEAVPHLPVSTSRWLAPSDLILVCLFGSTCRRILCVASPTSVKATTVINSIRKLSPIFNPNDPLTGLRSLAGENIDTTL